MAVEGTVETSNDEPLELATVTVIRDGSTIDSAEVTDGSFSRTLAPGTYGLEVSATGYEDDVVELEATHGETLTPALTLERETTDEADDDGLPGFGSITAVITLTSLLILFSISARRSRAG